MRLYEQYRPSTLDDVVGQDRAVKIIRAAIRRGWGGQSYWISGASGTGKTTLARIIAGTGADPLNIREYDSADAVTVGELESWEDIFSYRGWLGETGKPGKAIIINEAHGLRKDIIRQLLGILERVPDHTVVIFTTTAEGQDGLFEDNIDASPLLSRCLEVRLSTQGLCKAFAAHCKGIAEAEGLDGQPVARYEKLAKSKRNNCRAMLQYIESGGMVE